MLTIAFEHPEAPIPPEPGKTDKSGFKYVALMSKRLILISRCWGIRPNGDVLERQGDGERPNRGHDETRKIALRTLAHNIAKPVPSKNGRN